VLLRKRRYFIAPQLGPSLAETSKNNLHIRRFQTYLRRSVGSGWFTRPGYSPKSDRIAVKLLWNDDSAKSPEQWLYRKIEDDVSVFSLHLSGQGCRLSLTVLAEARIACGGV
jgi:hypothetical protein